MSVFLSPLAPKLRDQEIAASFVSRLAAWLRYTTARLFCADFGLNFDRISAGDPEQLQLLALLTGTSVEDFKNSPVRSGKVFFIEGHALASVYLDRLDFWICPECVADDLASAPHLPPEASIAVRRDNIVRAVATCQKHRRDLVLVGRNRGRGYRHDTSIVAMDISAQLSTLMAKSEPKVPSFADEFMWDRLEGRPSAVPILEHMPLRHAIMIASRLGNWVQSGDRDNLRRMSRPRFNEVMSAGVTLLAGGREALTAELNRQLSETDFFNAAPVGQSLSKVRRMLFHYRTDPHFLPIEHMLDDAVAHCAYVKNSKEVGENKWTAITALSPEMGHAPYILKGFANAAGAVHPTKATWANKKRLVDWMNAEGGLVTAYNAASAAGLTKHQVRILIEHRRLSLVVPSRNTCGSYSWIRQGHVNAMLERILQNAEKVDVIAPGKTNILGLIKRTHRSFLTLHDALTNGEFDVQTLVGEKPYASILFDIKQATQVLEAKFYAPPPPRDGVLTKSEFARALNTSIASVAELSKPNGLVRSVPVFNPRSRRNVGMIPAEELDRFQRTYIKLTEVAAFLKVHPREVLNRLSSKGIHPVKSGKPTVTWFRRSDLAKL